MRDILNNYEDLNDRILNIDIKIINLKLFGLLNLFLFWHTSSDLYI
jgi:hypothetical protein